MYFFLLAIKNITLNVQATISATVIDNQIPSILNISGKIRTQDIWHTQVLKNDTPIDIFPLFKEVKNEDVKIVNPENKKENEKNLKALTVKAKRYSS